MADQQGGQQGNTDTANQNNQQGNNDQKPADQKPADQKPADQKPADQQGDQGKPPAAAGDAPAVKTPDQLHDAAIAATEAWQANPTPELKAAAQKAVDEAKTAVAAEKKSKADAAAAAKAPDNYNLKLPEKTLLTDAYLDGVKAYAKANNLTQEAAQKVVDRDSQVVGNFQQGQHKQMLDMQDTWISTAKADKEYGGDNFGKNAELAKRVLTRFATPDFMKVLDDPEKGRFGNHPELVRFAIRIGKAMGEDQFESGPIEKNKQGESFADSFYGKPS